MGENLNYPIQMVCAFSTQGDKEPIRKLGIHTHRATYDGYYQYDLFSGIRIDKLRAIDSTVDDIRNRYGYETLKRACFVNDIQRKET